MVNILSLFDDMQKNSFAADQNRFVAVTIPEYPHFHLAKDREQSPSLLISATDSTTKRSTAPIILEHLSVTFDVPCRISKRDGMSEENIFTVIRCTGQERLLHTYFLRTIRLLFDLLPTPPTKTEVGQAVSTLVELFRSIKSSPQKSLQGLWAELLIIDIARYPEILVEAWHATPQDRYDFNAGNERIEVKSTSQRIRQHHFSLDQVNAIDDTQVIIASLFTEPVNNGTTIIELADNIREKIKSHPKLVSHLDRIVITTLGDNWRIAFEEAFDKSLAISTLRFFDVISIPKIQSPLPVGISDVHFKADLSACETVNLTQISKDSKLFSFFIRKQ